MPLRPHLWDPVSSSWLGYYTTPSPPLDTFVSGLDAFGMPRRGTRPTEDNTGVDPYTELDPYTGPNAGGLLTVSTPGRVYEDVDFGTTRIRVIAPDVGFINCKWRFTNLQSNGAAIDFLSANNTGGGFMKRCTVENVGQHTYGYNGIAGWNLLIERCKVEGFVDNLTLHVPGFPGYASLPMGVTVLDTYLGAQAFFHHPTGGRVHSVDTKTHNDCIQCHGGYGLRLINTTVMGHYSKTVGTGTVGSGSEFGWDTAYTQAQGEAIRYEIVMGNGTYDGENGGSTAGVLFTVTGNSDANSKGNVIDMEMLYCWASGGAYWLNPSSAHVGHFGLIKGLRAKNNQRHPGRAIVVPSHMTVDLEDNIWVDDDWNETGITIPRRTG